MQPGGCKREREVQEMNDTWVRRNAQKSVDSAGRRLQHIVDARNCHTAINTLFVKYPNLHELKQKFDLMARNGYQSEDVGTCITAARKIIALIHYMN